MCDVLTRTHKPAMQSNDMIVRDDVAAERRYSDMVVHLIVETAHASSGCDDVGIAVVMV